MGFLCQLCGARYLEKVALISHLEIHRIGFLCEKCLFISPTVIHQSMHAKVCATNDLPTRLVLRVFKCPSCRYCASNTSDLVHHITAKHEVPSNNYNFPLFSRYSWFLRKIFHIIFELKKKRFWFQRSIRLTSVSDDGNQVWYQRRSWGSWLTSHVRHVEVYE